MYASDYYNGCDKSPDTNCWLYIKNGLSISTSLSGNAQNEWTMSRNGNYDSDYLAWDIDVDGTLKSSFYLNATISVRPTFYLIPNITLTGGGTESDPFIIHAS